MDLTSYYRGKHWLAELVHLDTNTLHVHVGLAVIVGGGLLLRFRPRAMVWLWLALLGAQLLNEAVDLAQQITSREPIRWVDSIADTINTVWWPLLLVLWLRLRGGRTATPSDDATPTPRRVFRLPETLHAAWRRRGSGWGA